jgi:phospholipid transport system substrate-binding protein
MNGRWISLALAAGLLAAAPAGAAGSTPRAVVEDVTSQAIKVLGDQGLSSADKRSRLEQIIYSNVDFETLSRLVLAQSWSRFSDAQKSEFIAEFKRHLSMTYGRNVETYNNEKVTITGERDEPRGDHTVLTKIAHAGDDILVDYRLREKDGRWQIIDFVIEKVSLVANYRAQFQDMLAHGTPDSLLRALHDKNERGEPLKAPKA